MSRGERMIIGKGSEHTVYLSMVNPNKVIKIPTLISRIYLCLKVLTPKDVEDDFREAQQITQETGITIPETRVRAFAGYSIVQEFVLRDNSLNPTEYVEQNIHNTYLRNRYFGNPSNFIPSNGILYWVDPGKEPIGRLLSNTKLLNYESFYQLKTQVKRLAERIHIRIFTQETH